MLSTPQHIKNMKQHPFLLSAEQAAEFLSVSSRTFHVLRREPWMPKPVVLGVRSVRWVRSELEEAVAKLPKQEVIQDEPEQLQAVRVHRIGR